MQEEHQITKAELIDEINSDWSALQEALRRLTPEQLTEIRDHQGWTVKDHISHLTAWERSVVYFLQGKPRHEGLGVDQHVYDADDTDKINAAVQRQTADVTLDQTLAELRDVHTRLLALLEPLSDADLYRRYRAYLPDEPGEGDGPPALDVIRGNSSEHYREHLEWIGELASKR